MIQGKTWKKCVHGTKMPQSRQTGSTHMSNLKRVDTVHLTLKTCDIKYLINLSLKLRKFDENFTAERFNQSLCKEADKWQT